MSNVSAVRIASIIFLSFIIPIAFLLWLFDSLGISEFVFPILLPIFGYTILIMVVITAVIFVAVRRSTNLVSTMSQRGYTSQSYQPSVRNLKPVYIIPMECPGCGRELELSQVEWRDKFTIVCPSCFSDVNIQTSNRI